MGLMNAYVFVKICSVILLQPLRLISFLIIIASVVGLLQYAVPAHQGCLLPAIKLTVTFLYFSLFGLLFVRLPISVFKIEIPFIRHISKHALLYLPLMCCIGQLVHFFLYYIINIGLFADTFPFLFYRNFFVQQFVSFSIYTIILLLLYCEFRLNREVFYRDFFKEHTSHFAYYTFFILIITFIFWVICTREYGREIMLSTDPDQHLFWALQLKKVGHIPWNLGLWGDDSFNYPAGFAVLNVIWSKVTNFPLPDIITMQPILQAQLLILASFSFVLLFFELLLKQKKISINPFSYLDPFPFYAGCLFCIYIFYTTFPWGYQELYYHSEGTGRISAMVLSGFSVFGSLGILLFRRDIFSKIFIKKEYTFEGIAFILSLLSVLNAFINPAHFLTASVPLCIFFCFSIKELLVVNERVQFRHRTVLFFRKLLIPSLLGFGAILLDPYYWNRFFGNAQKRVSTAVKTGEQVFTTAFKESFNDKISKLPSQDGISDFLQQGFSSDYNVYIALLIVPFIVLLIFKDFGRIFLKQVFLFELFLLCFYLVVHSLCSAVSTLGDLYLLPAYFRYALYQIQYSVLFTIIIVSIVYCFFLIRERLLSELAVVVICICVSYFTLFDENKLAVVNLAPRYLYNSTLPEDDKKVMGYIEEYTEQFISNPQNSKFLNYKRIPKILIPNYNEVMNREKWSFPIAAARALVRYETFPLAFFYFQGASAIYTFENYQKYVCDRLDIRWLAQRNIRFLFLPSDRRGMCLAKATPSSANLYNNSRNIIFQSGKSVFLKLY
jgi:hypothetical protein